MSDLTVIWVFCGTSSQFPNAVFSDRGLAEHWIAENHLSGILSAYPLDQSIYDWAVSNGFFTPTQDKHRTPQFIEKFTSASQEHYHYEAGVP
jgi:hypothetical protein